MKSDSAADAGKETKPPDLRPDPLDARDPPPVDRYCDLVLTGGVTDGVIYPWAVIELARKYRFNDIGGSSVGAMAAALTAAAEYGRRYGSLTGFNEVLLKLPDKLAETEQTTGETKLFSLFQPDKSTRRLFDVFVTAFSMNPAATKGDGIRTVAGAILKAYRRQAIQGGVLGIALAFLLWLGPSLVLHVWHRGTNATAGMDVGLPVAGELTLLLALILAAIGALALIGRGIYDDLLHGLVPNGFGLCTGFRKDTAAPGPQTLVEWLHLGIQAAAGKPLDAPLTFRDLWDAPGGPDGQPLPPVVKARKSRSIGLRMVTTNLTHGRPYALPPDDQTSRLFFRLEELARYFPASVLDHLLKHSRPYQPRPRSSDPEPTRETRGLRELPNGDLPIVVAARLSLSFPILFSAVPLWAIDYEPRGKEQRGLGKCWFSDGGICSNFPIHLFDSALPRWPTFGISLAPRSIFWSKETIWLTKYHYQGRGDAWDRFGDEESPIDPKEKVPPASRLVGFLLSIVWSAKDWKDKTSMRMPGVRDRVVHVAMDKKKGEGGLNLRLTGEEILKYASRYGLPAGRALVGKFIGSGPGDSPAQAWNEHRWVRFNTLLVALRERIEGIREAADLTAYAKPLAQQIVDAKQTPPLSEAYDQCVLTATQAEALLEALDALKDLEAKLARTAAPQPYTPLPTPTMHLRPPL